MFGNREGPSTPRVPELIYMTRVTSVLIAVGTVV